MSVDRFSVFTADSQTNPRTWGLNLDTFSRFKHGSVSAANGFAELTAALFVAKYPFTALTEPLVVTASCYKHVPLASVVLAEEVARILNEYRAIHDVSPVTQTQIYRSQLIEGDYSSMRECEREAFIEQDYISGDATLLGAGTILVIDDVRITGNTEQLILTYLQSVDTPRIVFGYVASLYGRDDATLERGLNQATVKNLDDLWQIIATEEFRLNSRCCKAILEATPDDRNRFLSRIAVSLLREIITGIECNGYANMSKYRLAYQQMLCVSKNREGGIA